MRHNRRTKSVSRRNNGISDIGFSNPRERDNTLKIATMNMIDEILKPIDRSTVSVKSNLIFRIDRISNLGINVK